MKKSIFPNLWNKWFGSWKSLDISLKKIKTVSPYSSSEYLYEQINTFPVIKEHFFSYSLQINYSENIDVRIKGISKKYKDELYLIDEYYKDYFVNKFKNYLVEIESRIYKRYLKDSWIDDTEIMVNWVIDNYDENSEKFIDELSEKQQNFITELKKISPIETNKEIIRANFEEIKLIEDKSFFENVESNALTEKQSLATIRENDANLILAAAGTGKTSVMVSKALYLVKNGLAKPNEVLILAFAKKAGEELDERIKNSSLKLHNKTRPFEVRTFHSLGRHILAQCKQKTFVSTLASDERRKQKFIQNNLENFLLLDPKNLKSFESLIYARSNPFNFENIIDYENFLKQNEYRCLSGDLMKGYQEVLIGNFLYKNNIEFEYESPYIDPKTGDRYKYETNTVYKPDFYLPNHGIYIEHFGIDRGGNVRQGIDKFKYNDQIKNKIDLHQEKNTNLITTYHYEWVEGTLIDDLIEKLNEFNLDLDKKIDEKKQTNPEINKVVFDPLPSEKILDRLRELNFISDFSKLVANAIDVIKESNLNDEDISRSLDNLVYFSKEEFLLFLDYLKERYQEELQKSESIDFHDMIHQSKELIESGHFKSKWKYILVDEYQDISQSRNNLIKSLLNQVHDSCLTVVGDDWQSIFRFTGSRLDLITDFASSFNGVSSTILDKSFRYNNFTADVAGQFVMKNPHQIKKEITTLKTEEDTKIFILNESKLEKIIDQIIDKSKNKQINIMILARANWILEEAKEQLIMSGFKHLKKLQFNTIHSSKGLEADHVIVIGCNKDRIPSDKKSNEVIECLLPSLDNFLFSEERRLMYVSLTRTKGNCYLLTDPIDSSSFIDELIFDSYAIQKSDIQLEPRYRKIYKCRNCESGFMRRKESYYICTNWTFCKTSSSECPNCKAPMHEKYDYRKCNNEDSCNQTLALCPKCYKPLVKRTGPFGSFWGCSGFHRKAKNPCTYKTKTPPKGFIETNKLKKTKSIFDLFKINN
jgi:DNA helicase-4